MKKFIVKLNHQIEIEANNKNEAYEKFFEGVETEPQQTLATFVSDNLTIKEKINKKTKIGETKDKTILEKGCKAFVQWFDGSISYYKNKKDALSEMQREKEMKNNENF